MKYLLVLFGILALAGCETPCTELNASLVAIYEDCGVEIPTDLEDGGRGGECGATAEESDCSAACYEASGCAGIDGSDQAAADDRGACVAACSP